MTKHIAKRFYEKVTIRHSLPAQETGTPQNKTQNHILLDGQILKSPKGHTLALPTLALAQKCAAELEDVEERPDLNRMPFTKMSYAIHDDVRPGRVQIIQSLTNYASNDLLYYRADERDHALFTKQAQIWDPILARAAHLYGVEPAITRGIMPVDQPPELIKIMRNIIIGHDDYALGALSALTHNSGSLFLALTAMRRIRGTGEATDKILYDDEKDSESNREESRHNVKEDVGPNADLKNGDEYNPKEEKQSTYIGDDLWLAGDLDARWQERQWGVDEEAKALREKRHEEWRQTLAFYRLSFI